MLLPLPCSQLMAAALYLGLPRTYEGGEMRCFRHMFVCLRDLDTEAYQLHSFGQYLVRYYGGNQVVINQTEQHPPGGQFQVPPPVSIIRQLGLRRAQGGGGGKEQVLRIVFQTRAGTERQLVNIAELLETCNAWRYTTQSGARLRALCWEVGAAYGRIRLLVWHLNCCCC